MGDRLGTAGVVGFFVMLQLAEVEALACRARISQLRVLKVSVGLQQSP